MTAAPHNEHHTTTARVLFMAFELSEKTWKLGFTTGHGQKPRERTVAAREFSSLSASSSASARFNQCSRNSASGARLPPLGAGGRLGGQVARHRVGAHGWRTRLVEKAV